MSLYSTHGLCVYPQVLSHVTLEKEDDATLLLCTATSSDFVKVRVGLYLPCLQVIPQCCLAPSLGFHSNTNTHAATEKATAMVVVVRSSKETLSVAAPFRVGARSPGDTTVRVFRDCVPETRVPGLCAVLSFATGSLASQWAEALAQHGGCGNSAPVGTEAVLHVVNGSTWARMPDVCLAGDSTVAAVLDRVVDEGLHEIPTEFQLCFSQPSPANVFAASSVVSDSGVCF